MDGFRIHQFTYQVGFISATSRFLVLQSCNNQGCYAWQRQCRGGALPFTGIALRKARKRGKLTETLWRKMFVVFFTNQESQSYEQTVMKELISLKPQLGSLGSLCWLERPQQMHQLKTNIWYAVNAKTLCFDISYTRFLDSLYNAMLCSRSSLPHSSFQL